MKNFIKFLSLILTLSMLLCLFAACGNNNGDETDTDTESDTAAADTEEPEEALETVKIVTEEQFKTLITALNENPEASKGKYYKLFVDVNYVVGWDASPASAFGKLQAPGAIAEFPGINEFYGVFDGNGKTISSIYRVDSEAAGGVVGGFIDKLNGGTVKNVTFNSAYVFDGGKNGAAVGGLIGTVNGDGSALENVTVNANVYSANDAAVTIGGIVGTVEASDFTMTKCTFGGKLGNVAADLTIPSASTSAKLAQLIGDAGDKAVTLTECAANGDIICADGATKDTYANGSAVTKTDCTTEPCPNPGVVEVSEYKVYTADELLAVVAYDSTFDGSTIKLMADIDLNEDWTAGTTVPAKVWTGIDELKGTFDGNGKVLKGVYTTKSALIGTLNGGTVKNLAIINSAVVYTADAASNVGIVGTAKGGTVEIVYSELDIYVTGTASCNIGGIVGETKDAVTVKNIIVNGEISAEGKTVDQVIAKQSATSVVSDILAIGTGDVSTTGRTNIFTEKQTSAPAGTAWTEVKYLGSFAPKEVAVIVISFAPLVADTTWYNAELNEFTLTTPEQLLGLSLLTQTVYGPDGPDDDEDPDVVSEGLTFEGKIIKLGADIDFNPTWDATTTVASNNVVTLAAAPKNVWASIPLFKGTIDGQGHTIRGIYSESIFEAPTDFKYWGGFINELVGGTVKNLIVENSLAYFTSTPTTTKGTSKIGIGGFIGRVTDSTLDTLYVDIDSWNEFKYHYTMGGMICAVHTEAADDKYVGSISNIVYAGSTGRIGSDGTWNAKEGSSRIYCAGMIAQNHLVKDGNDYCYITMTNLSHIGMWYRPANEIDQVTGDPVLGYTSGTAYNTGMAVNNSSCYIDEVSAGKNVGDYNKTNSLTDKAVDYVSNSGKVTEGDTYSTNNDWATMDIATGCGKNTGIVLPKTVVDMLNARNNTNA